MVSSFLVATSRAFLGRSHEATRAGFLGDETLRSSVLEPRLFAPSRFVSLPGRSHAVVLPFGLRHVRVFDGTNHVARDLIGFFGIHHPRHLAPLLSGASSSLATCGGSLLLCRSFGHGLKRRGVRPSLLSCPRKGGTVGVTHQPRPASFHGSTFYSACIVPLFGGSLQGFFGAVPCGTTDGS